MQWQTVNGVLKLVPISADDVIVIRSGYDSYSKLKGGHANMVNVPITFSSPMPNATYQVYACVDDAYADYLDVKCYCFKPSRTVNGCTISVTSPYSTNSFDNSYSLMP